MHARGDLRPVDAAIFADTLDEPRAVYQQLDWLQGEIAKSRYPFPIYRVTHGRLWDSASKVRTTRDGQRRYIKTAIPLHFVNGDGKKGRGMRSCSQDFKIDIITAKAKELIGRRRKRIKPSEGFLVHMMIGFTVDEALRMKDNSEPWIRNVYPLIEASMSRADCHVWSLREYNRTFVGSSCKFCPNRTDWGALDPDELQECIERERVLQASYAEIGFSGTPYLHQSRIPLSSVKISSTRRRKMAEEQTNMFVNQCNGGCGT
jgi:hypothetical protein